MKRSLNVTIPYAVQLSESEIQFVVVLNRVRGREGELVPRFSGKQQKLQHLN